MESTPKLTKGDFSFLMSKFTDVVKTSNVVDQNKISDVMLKLKLQVLDTEKSEVASQIKFESFTENNVSDLRQLLRDSLSDLNSSVAVKIDNISYNATKATVKIDVFPMDTGILKDPNAILKAEYLSDLPKFRRKGFKEECFLKEFTHNGKNYEFVGFIPTGRTYKYKARVVGSTQLYKFSGDIEKKVTGL